MVISKLHRFFPGMGSRESKLAQAEQDVETLLTRARPGSRGQPDLDPKQLVFTDGRRSSETASAEPPPLSESVPIRI